ncbi:MAG: DUF547 domain-containing protein, partial [Pseudomonadota bacterium]
AAPALALAGPLAAPARAAPSARLLDDRWTRHGDASETDAAAWSGFLGRYRVLGEDGIARLRFGAVTGEDKRALDAQIGRWAAIDPTSLTRDATFAYWANYYNALTVRMVLEVYPVRSIRDIGGSLFNPGPWREKVTVIAGVSLSLDDIEHGIMRPVFGDARVHYAVNCAALGCPNLPDRAFAAADLDARLDGAARAFVNHPRGARVEDGRLTVSSIYHWFEEDFGGDDRGVVAHLKRYAEAPLDSALEGVARVADHDYDWALNDAT